MHTDAKNTPSTDQQQTSHTVHTLHTHHNTTHIKHNKHTTHTDTHTAHATHHTQAAYRTQSHRPTWRETDRRTHTDTHRQKARRTTLRCEFSSFVLKVGIKRGLKSFDSHEICVSFLFWWGPMHLDLTCNRMSVRDRQIRQWTKRIVDFAQSQPDTVLAQRRKSSTAVNTFSHPVSSFCSFCDGWRDRSRLWKTDSLKRSTKRALTLLRCTQTSWWHDWSFSVRPSSCPFISNAAC